MLKDILVVVDSGSQTEVIDLAAGLAAQHGAHLTGLLVSVPVRMPQYLDASVREEIDRIQGEVIRTSAAAIEAQFLETASKLMTKERVEWQFVTGDPDAVVADRARCADLTVMGQLEPDQAEDVLRANPDYLLFSSGHPLLVVPYAGVVPKKDGPAAKVLIAWNDSSAAARAVADALPILRRAKKVIVLSINPSFRPPNGVSGGGPGADLVHHLARHGVAAEARHVNVGNTDPGDMLLNQAADLGADLIVMGGYGRSRLRELVLGGTTRHIMQHMTVPVLFSH